MTIEPPHPGPDDWALLVGRFMLAFGEIELFSHLLWGRLRLGDKAPSGFRPRTEAIIKALRRMDPVPNQLISALQSAILLAPKRNTVAHNPMSVQVFQHTQTEAIALEYAISSESTNDYITDRQLEELASQARVIVNELASALWTGIVQQPGEA